MPIKVGARYFQIPENFIEYSYLRVPTERKQMPFRAPLGEVFPSLFTDGQLEADYQNAKVDLVIQDSSTLMLGGRIYSTVTLSDHVFAFVPSELVFPDRRISTPLDAVTAYLLKISTTIAPENWNNAYSLARAFRLGDYPCVGWEEFRPTPDLTSVTYEEMVQGLTHQNEQIRIAAAAAIGNTDASHQPDALSRLHEVIATDSSIRVKQAAVKGVATIAETNGDAVQVLINVMSTHENELVRRQAAASIATPMANMSKRLPHVPIEALLDLVKDDNEATFETVGPVLAWALYHEVKTNHIEMAGQLTPRAILALNGAVSVLTRTTRDNTRTYLLLPLLACDDAIATKNFVEIVSLLMAKGNASAGKTYAHLSKKAIDAALKGSSTKELNDTRQSPH